MTTKNNWLTTSLSERTPANLCDFTITINPYPFEVDTFKNNSNRVAHELAEKYSNLYLLYSGGLDSEYVLKTFIVNKLPITPVLIVTPFNKPELSYAVKFLKMHNIKPFIIEYTKENIFTTIKKIVYNKCFYSFMAALNYEACTIISNKNGKILSGSGDHFNSIKNTSNIKEFAFYIEEHPDNHIGGFFTYDLSLYYSMLNEIDNDTGNIQLIKSKVYNLEHRQKIYWDKEFYYEFHKSKLNIKKYEITVDKNFYLKKLLTQEKTIIS